MSDSFTLNPSWSFAEYIHHCRQIIQEKREDLTLFSTLTSTIIDANSPFEFLPKDSTEYGALLLHGLLDSPFSVKDIAARLSAEKIWCRALLLPGHGTTPKDLLHTSHRAWIETVRYGVATLRKKVKKIFLVGYSTGSTLAIYHALQDPEIAGLVLIAPALKINISINFLLNWRAFMNKLIRHKPWICIEEEINYVKYRSIPLNSVTQLIHIINLIKNSMRHHHQITCPIFIAMSRNDETVSSQAAINFFTHFTHPKSEFLLYCNNNHRYKDPRILTRHVKLTDSAIKDFSHIALLFSPDNPYYGKNGNYLFASHSHTKEYIYGAYNHITVQMYELLYNLGLIRKKRRELTYNPDFDYLAEKIVKFINER